MKNFIKKISLKLQYSVLYLIPFLIPKIVKALSVDEKIDKYYLPDVTTIPEQYLDELSTASQLPEKSVPEVLSDIANILLGLTGTIAMVGLIVAGVMYVTARGDDQQMEKAKNILIYIAIGLVVIAASYAIILGVSSLSFD